MRETSKTSNSCYETLGKKHIQHFKKTKRKKKLYTKIYVKSSFLCEYVYTICISPNLLPFLFQHISFCESVFLLQSNDRFSTKHVCRKNLFLLFFFPSLFYLLLSSKTFCNVLGLLKLPSLVHFFLSHHPHLPHPL